MVYLNNIPNATDFLSQSQSQLKENFSQLETQFSVDHDSLLAGHATGKHLKLTLPKRAADPTTVADEIVLYTKAVGADVNLFYRNQNNGTVNQITYSPQPYIRAFGHCDKLGTLIGTSLNLASVVTSVSGDNYKFKFTFTTPLADSNYTILATPSFPNFISGGAACDIIERTATNFTVSIFGDNAPRVASGLDVLILKV
jgi:hypothetical protein